MSHVLDANGVIWHHNSSATGRCIPLRSFWCILMIQIILISLYFMILWEYLMMFLKVMLKLPVTGCNFNHYWQWKSNATHCSSNDCLSSEWLYRFIQSYYDVFDSKEELCNKKSQDLFWWKIAAWQMKNGKYLGMLLMNIMNYQQLTCQKLSCHCKM